MKNVFDLNAVRKEFPVTTRMLYLDSAHQTPLALSVRDAVLTFYNEALEMAGPKPIWMRRAEETRVELAEFIGASADEILYTKNTSEGLNIAANALPLKAGDNVLMIEGDHPNNAYAWLNLRRKGVEVRFIKLNGEDSVASAATFAPHIDSRTRAISLSHVTFHAGQRHQIADIGTLCKKHGIYLVIDAMQSIGVLPIDVKELGVSLMAAGCHKGLLVSQGMGFLYVSKEVENLQPAFLAMSGMAHPPADYIATPDDMELRPAAGRFEMGNHNLPNLHALSASLALINKVGVRNIEEHVLLLGDRLLTALDALGVKVIGPRDRQHRAHIYVLDLPVNEWVDYLAQNQVRVSAERGGVRISFAIFNNSIEVDRLVELIKLRLAKEIVAGTPEGDSLLTSIQN